MNVGIWIFPSLATIVVWAWAILWPMPGHRGDYDFTGLFVGMIRLFFVVTVTLAAWLLFFAVKYYAA